MKRSNSICLRVSIFANPVCGPDWGKTNPEHLYHVQLVFRKRSFRIYPFLAWVANRGIVSNCIWEEETLAGEVAANSCVATNFSPWLGVHVHVPPGYFRELLDKPDAVQAAGQLGRLDLLTGVLASLAIMIAFASVVGFWIIRGSAINSARRAAEDEIRQELPILAPKLIAEELRRRPDLVAQAIKNDPSVAKTFAEAYETLFGEKSKDVPENVLMSFDVGEENGNGAR